MSDQSFDEWYQQYRATHGDRHAPMKVDVNILDEAGDGDEDPDDTALVEFDMTKTFSTLLSRSTFKTLIESEGEQMVDSRGNGICFTLRVHDHALTQRTIERLQGGDLSHPTRRPEAEASAVEYLLKEAKNLDV